MMKSKILSIFVMLLSVSIISCSEDDLKPTGVPAQAKAYISTEYPGVQRVEWEREGGFIKADLKSDGVEVEVYFKVNGTWVRTETDYHMPLPEAVTTYIQTQYAGYYIDNQELVKTAEGDRYFKLELERENRRDVTVLIREDGSLVK